MKSSTVNIIKLEPSENMHLRNKNTGEVYEGFIYLAKSLTEDDFEEITNEEYLSIIDNLNNDYDDEIFEEDNN